MVISDRQLSSRRTILSSYQRKSSNVSQELCTKFLPIAEKCIDFRDFFSSQNYAKNAGRSSKMRECGKVAKMRDFPHECGMVDTYG